MKVAVKMLGTQAGGCYELDADPMTTVSQLKLSLDADHGVSAGNHGLLYGGKVLKDTEKLAGENFMEHGVLAHVLLMTEGTASKKSAALHADSEEDAPARCKSAPKRCASRGGAAFRSGRC
jgi:hypothetical protein